MQNTTHIIWIEFLSKLKLFFKSLTQSDKSPKHNLLESA